LPVDLFIQIHDNLNFQSSSPFSEVQASTAASVANYSPVPEMYALCVSRASCSFDPVHVLPSSIMAFSPPIAPEIHTLSPGLQCRQARQLPRSGGEWSAISVKMDLVNLIAKPRATDGHHRDTERTEDAQRKKTEI